MEKKLFGGNINKNIVMGLSWIPFLWLLGLIAFIVDFKTLDVEEKREFVSIFVCVAVSIVLAITIIVPFVVGILMVIAAIMAFMGKTFKVPVAYQIASAIIK